MEKTKVININGVEFGVNAEPKLVTEQFEQFEVVKHPIATKTIKLFITIFKDGYEMPRESRRLLNRYAPPFRHQGAINIIVNEKTDEVVLQPFGIDTNILTSLMKDLGDKDFDGLSWLKANKLDRKNRPDFNNLHYYEDIGRDFYAVNG